MADKQDKTMLERVFAATRRAPKASKDIAAELSTEDAKVSTQAVTAQLKKLEGAGAVSRDPDGAWSRMPGVRKIPAELADALTAAEPKPKRNRASKSDDDVPAEVKALPGYVEPDGTGSAESAVGASNVVAGPWGNPDAVDAPEGSVDAVLADLQSVAPVSAPPAQAVRRAGRARASGGVEIVKGNRATQWAKGQLVQAIVAQLAAAGPRDDFSATEMTRRLNEARTAETDPIAQNGSVAFALDKMASAGTATLTQDKPRRYGKARKAA